MKMKKMILVFMVFGVAAGFIIGSLFPDTRNYEDRRHSLMDDMASLIEEKVDSGEYKCCIEPACDMCFLGHWLWDDGICRCDEMIASGQDDKVCPQCKKALEEGLCKSSSEVACTV